MSAINVAISTNNTRNKTVLRLFSSVYSMKIKCQVSETQAVNRYSKCNHFRNILRISTAKYF